TPYGCSHVNHGIRQLDSSEITLAQAMGKRLAQTAKKLAS
ncbi:transcriptional regulator, partial [Photobacterium damselae]